MEQLVNFIIRPPRAEYTKNDLLDEEFMLKGKWYQRKDLELTNSRGHVLQCSHYMPIVSPEGKPLPCVIYCHGNSGCRADAGEAAIILLPSNITVFTLDFSGSGLSGGDHVTLGWNEKDDLKAVVDYLRAAGNVSLIGLWGRSMGAVTSLLYGSEDPSIAGMVLDSPFSDLVDLMMELVDTYKFRLPKFTVKLAIQYMKRSIQKKAGFDITELNTIKVAKSCFVPALFGHADEDDFIRPHHSDQIFEAYMGDKNIIKFEGDHNSPRPQFYFDSINIFFHNVLQPPDDEVGGTFFDTMYDYIGKGSWSPALEVGHDQASSTALKVPETSSTSTVDAIEQVRSKRPMSRTEVPSSIPTTNNQSEGEEGDDHCPSSSSMISFDLSNGSPFGPPVATTMDDDQYVEYALDDLAGFPCNVEEEERMFMEAVIESLKELETRNPHAEEQPSVCTSSSETSKQEGNDISLAKEQDGLKKTESSNASLSNGNGHSLASENPSPDKSESSAGHAPETPSAAKPASEGGTTCIWQDSSPNAHDTSEADMSSNTRATLTVEKSPANHIMDGLMRRWDLNFFRNGR